MRNILFIILILFSIHLNAQWYKEEPKSTLFYELFPSVGGDVGITDTLYVGSSLGTWQLIIDSTGEIKKYRGVAPPLGYVLTGTGTGATFQPSAAGGSVVNVSSGDFTPLFTVSIASPTTTPTFSFNSIAHGPNLVYASPDGVAGLPNFRNIVPMDIINFTDKLIVMGDVNTNPYQDPDVYFDYGTREFFLTNNIDLFVDGEFLTGNSGATKFDSDGYITQYATATPIVGDIFYADPSGKMVLLPIGAPGDVLTSDGTVPSWGAGGGGGATVFTALTDVPSSYVGQARKLVAVNSGETGLEFISTMQESGTNIRVGTGTQIGNLYNTIYGIGSKSGAANNYNTLYGYNINTAGSAYDQNSIFGAANLVVNAGSQSIFGSVITGQARVAGANVFGSFIDLPTTGSYAFEVANSLIAIGTFIDISDAATTKGGIMIGRNINTGSFASTNTTAPIIISQDPTLSDGMQNSLGIGYAISILNGEPNVTVLGNQAMAYVDGTYGSAGGQSVAVGYLSKAGAWRSVAVGAYSQALGVSSIALGFGAYANKAHSDAWGRGAYNDVADATLIYGSPATGVNNIGTLYFGAIAAKHTNPAMPGSEVFNIVANLNAGTAYATITTASGRDADLVPTETSVRGAHLRIQAGASTGTAAGGDLSLGVTLAGGVSNNTENTWDEALKISGADAHIYITQDPDDDNTNTKVLSRDPVSQEIEETDLPTGVTFQQIYGIISLKL